MTPSTNALGIGTGGIRPKLVLLAHFNVRLHVELEEQNIAILHDVLFAF